MGQWGYSPGQYWSAPPPRRTSRGAAVVLAVALLIVVAMGAGFGIGHLAWQSGGSTPSTNSPSSGSGNFPFGSGSFPFGSGTSGSGSSASGGPADAAAIASGVDPALVDVNTTLGYAAEEAAGTGIVLTSTGEVLTNNHVIDGATSISVTDVGNGRVYPATIVGYDRSADVAVIQLQGASGPESGLARRLGRRFASGRPSSA